MTDGETVLIAGAGPTGLTLACTLLQRGVACRVVDRRTGPASEPKALILWSGALEVLRRVGAADSLVKRSLPLSGASYWSNGRRTGRVRFGALADTAFPRPLCVPQSVTESVLYARLLELGGAVEWNTRLTGVRTGGAGAAGAGVAAGLVPHGPAEPGADGLGAGGRGAGGTGAGAAREVSARWLVGADGAHSTVREAAGIAFLGSTYARDFLLGDGDIAGDLPRSEAQYHLTPEGVMVVVPLPGGGHRIFFDRDATDGTGPLTDEDLQALLTARGPRGWQVRSTWWRSTFRVHTKVAEAFRAGPVFLAGDAAHCHSPAGGQGLNTGVQDAFDLGWKLAAVAHGADPALLDSYEAERRPAALRALRNSDRQTRLWLLREGPKRAVRDTVLKAASATGALDRTIVPQLAQLDPGLAGSPAVPGGLGTGGGRNTARRPRGLRPGGRLPDAAWRALSGTAAGSLHALLSAGRHTVLVVRGGAHPADAERAAGEAARLVGRCTVREGADVVLVLAGGEPGDTGAGPAPYARVVDTGGSLTGLAGREPLVVYVRPDGAVAAWCAPGDLPELVAGVPVLRAPAERVA
ncbi:FAD-dependent monooxygenase [Streptomyces sp. NPDC015131]|uniref:FAD-dependent monooxygenase n=1 Tax=Streptomyces sp. NPDC015131 TaxID=3364941 RepID=UPI003703550F